MTLPRLALALSTAACFLAAQPKPAPEVQSVATTHVDFPPGGTLHIERSIGELMIEGWDGPGMEMTVTKAPPLGYDAEWNARPASDESLEKVEITAESHGNDVFVRTAAPGIRHVWVTCHIRVPRSASLVIDRQGGEVHVADIAGDIRATTRRGEIALLLPPDRQYAIDARTKLGDVYSDYPGAERRRPWLVGHRFAPEDASAGHKLYLRAGSGDIIIQKIRRPPYPAPRP